jgi:hypothetical protein
MERASWLRETTEASKQAATTLLGVLGGSQNQHPESDLKKTSPAKARDQEIVA